MSYDFTDAEIEGQVNKLIAACGGRDAKLCIAALLVAAFELAEGHPHHKPMFIQACQVMLNNAQNATPKSSK